MAWNNGQVMEPGVYVNEPKPKTTKKGSSGVQSGALSISMDDLLQALTGSRQGVVSEQPLPKQTATKEPKETALKLPGLSSEMGGLAQALVGARRNRAQRYQATDPWSIGQSVIEDPGLAEGLGMKLDKPWKQGLFNIAQNLIGGYVGGKARQGLEEYDRPFMQAIQGAAQTGDFSKLPISSEDDPTGVLQMSLALSGVEDRKKQQQAFTEGLLKNGMTMGPGGVSLMPGYAEAVGQLERAKNPTAGQSIYPSMQPVTYGQLEQASKSLDIPIDELARSVNVTGDIDRLIKLKGASGEKLRQPNPSELQTLGASQRFETTIDELKSIAEQMGGDGSILNFGRGLNSMFDTSSPEYKYYGLLSSAQQEFARGRDSGALSNQDVARYGPLFEGSRLLDSKETILKRINDIKRRSAEGRNVLMDTLEKGGVNVQNFKEPAGAFSPSSGGTSGQSAQPETRQHNGETWIKAPGGWQKVK